MITDINLTKEYTLTPQGITHTLYSLYFHSDKDPDYMECNLAEVSLDDLRYLRDTLDLAIRHEERAEKAESH